MDGLRSLLERAGAAAGDVDYVVDAALAAAKQLAAENNEAELWVFHSTRLGRGSGLRHQARSLLEIFAETRRAGVTLRSVEDDAFLTNHPYMGGTHTPDLQVFTPLHHDGAVVAWAGSIAHHIDIGGRFLGTESAQCTELFQEGLIFPA